MGGWKDRVHLSFEDPTFIKDVEYSTVRRGVIDLPPGKFFDILDVKSKHIALGKTICSQVMRFCDLTTTDLVDEQSEKGQTPGELYCKMSVWHQRFDDREIITIIHFVVHDLYGMRI